jgi:hypothetical protein
VRARFLADLAVGAGRPLDQAVLRSPEWFGRNHPSTASCGHGRTPTHRP